MQTFGGVGAFLISALDEIGWLVSLPGRFIPEKGTLVAIGEEGGRVPEFVWEKSAENQSHVVQVTAKSLYWQ